MAWRHLQPSNAPVPRSVKIDYPAKDTVAAQSDSLEAILDMRDYDVQPVNRLAIDKKINVGYWYMVTPGGVACEAVQGIERQAQTTEHVIIFQHTSKGIESYNRRARQTANGRARDLHRELSSLEECVPAARNYPVVKILSHAEDGNYMPGG